MSISSSMRGVPVIAGMSMYRWTPQVSADSAGSALPGPAGRLFARKKRNMTSIGIDSRKRVAGTDADFEFDIGKTVHLQGSALQGRLQDQGGRHLSEHRKGNLLLLACVCEVLLHGPAGIPSKIGALPLLLGLALVVLFTVSSDGRGRADVMASCTAARISALICSGVI